MRTAIIIAIGLALLGVSLGIGYFAGGAAKMKSGALIYIGLSFVSAAVAFHLQRGSN